MKLFFRYALGCLIALFIGVFASELGAQIVFSPKGSGGGGGSGGTVDQGTSPWVVSGAVDVGTIATPVTVQGTVTATAGTGFGQDVTHNGTVGTTGPQVMRVAAAFGTLPTAITAGNPVRASADLQGVTFTRSPTDPCDGVAKSFFVINLAAAASTEIANASGSNHWYICAVNVVAAAAQGFLIAEDDTDNCVSITAGMNGGTTGATGWQLSANGGAAFGNGQGAIMRTATGGRYLCLVLSTTAQTSGTIAYVSAP